MESNLKWNEARKFRITASKCKRVASMKESTSPVAALQEILHYKQPFQTDFMKEGLDKEPEIIHEYIAQMQKDGHEVTVKKSGFAVSASHGFLGASPDGLVHDPLECTPDGLIEVKHIVLQGRETLKVALIRKGICKMFEGHISINRNHQYYFQVHQQMFCCSRIWTDFVVKGGTEMYKEIVHFNNSFWSEQLPKLENFFDKIVLPELAYPVLEKSTKPVNWIGLFIVIILFSKKKKMNTRAAQSNAGILSICFIYDWLHPMMKTSLGTPKIKHCTLCNTRL